MKSENSVVDYSYKSHSLIRKNAENRKALIEKQSLDSEIQGNNPLFFFGCCLIDHSGQQFACIHEHCHRCFNSDRLDKKKEFHALQFHPEDRKLWEDEVFPDILDFLNDIPAAELSEYRLSFNHRFILKNKTISEFLLEGTFSKSLSSKTPTLNLKVFSEIGDIKTDETINLTIYRYSLHHGYHKVFSKVYGCKSNSLLSLREMEIIKLCFDGLSSKMIAEKLNLSIHTVKNHKRNCMEKTFTHNISELINFCIKSRWM
jgi:DNA-binding CsgD family transcriptional regulator